MTVKIIDLLTNSVTRRPNGIAIKNGANKVSYEAMFTMVYKLSRQLTDAGCCKGDKVAIVLDNSIEYLTSFFAISHAQAIIVPLSARMTFHEATRNIRLADVSVVVTNEKYGHMLAESEGDFNLALLVCTGYDSNMHLQFKTVLKKHPSNNRRSNDIALMIPTSGSTGKPKIAVLTNKNLISNMLTYRSLMGFSSHNVALCGLPLHHIYCICAQILPHISLADTLVLSNGPFFPKDFLKTVESNAVTVTAFVPHMAILLSEFPCPQPYNISSLKYVTLSGGKTPVATQKLLRQKYGPVRFVNTYGMTETGSRISLAAPFDCEYPIDSVGRAMPGVEIRITDELGNNLSVDCVGQVEVRSSGVMKGYYRQPELTTEMLKDGWLKTGDMGRLDKAGNLYLEGRIKNVIISGGENILPSEIEQCLLEHDGILEAAVVSQKDKLLQEVPCAFIVKHSDYLQLKAVDVVKFCKKTISSQKIPRQIKFIQKLPRLSTSKIDRHALKQMANNIV